MKYLSAEPTKVSDISSSDFVGVSRSKEGRETEFSLLRLPSVKKNTKEGGEKIQTESDLTEVSPPMVKRSKSSEHALFPLPRWLAECERDAFTKPFDLLKVGYFRKDYPEESACLGTKKEKGPPLPPEETK